MRAAFLTFERLPLTRCAAQIIALRPFDPRRQSRVGAASLADHGRRSAGRADYAHGQHRYVRGKEASVGLHLIPRRALNQPLLPQNRETDILDEVLAIVSNSPRLPPVVAAAGKPALPSPSSLAKRMQTKAEQTTWSQLGLLMLAQGGLIAVYVRSVRGRRRGKDLKTN